MSQTAKLIQRIEWYANQFDAKPESVVSLKLRPVRSWAEGPADVFGRHEANAYIYSDEYEKVRELVALTEAPDGLASIVKRVRHPQPWGGGAFVFNESPKVLWIQHEGGLEWIGYLPEIIGMVGGLIQIYEKLSVEIGKRSSNKASRIRVEGRVLTLGLNQTLLGETSVPGSINKNALIKSITSMYGGSA